MEVSRKTEAVSTIAILAPESTVDSIVIASPSPAIHNKFMLIFLLQHEFNKINRYRLKVMLPRLLPKLSNKVSKSIGNYQTCSSNDKSTEIRSIDSVGLLFR